MGSGIYKIKNLINNKVYIGSSVDIHKRLVNHKYKLRKNIHDNIYLQSSYNKYKKENFTFEILENCFIENLVEKENYYINLYNSINPDKGYNLTLVTDSRRNDLLDVSKLKTAKSVLTYYGNINRFKLINIISNEEFIFDNLIDAAKYLIKNNFTKGSEVNVRKKLSYCLRNKIVNNGSNGSKRKTIYKHTWEILK